MSQCRHFLVSGRVQGVFFRASAQAQAQALGLTGWVRNRADGCVELIACGDEPTLVRLEEWLWQGPSHAKVAQVERREVEPQVFSGFRVVG